MTSARRLSLLLEQLLHEESDKRAIQLARCLLGPKTLAPRCLSEPAGVTYFDRVAHVLELVKQGLKVEDEVDSSQLFVLLHRHLCS